MAMIECKECHHQVSDSAKACPHCGARVKPQSRWWMWGLGVPAAVFMFFLVGALLDPLAEQKRVARIAYDLCIKQFTPPAQCAQVRDEIIAKARKGLDAGR